MFKRILRPGRAAARIASLVLLITLVGCAQSVDGDPTLVGTWDALYDGFSLVQDGSAYTFTYYNIDTGTGDKTTQYAGTVVNEPDLSAQEGVLVFKVTEVSPSLYDPHVRVDSYYAASWESLSATGVLESGAYKSWFDDVNGNYTQDDGEEVYQEIYDALLGMDTPEAAEAEYTAANGFFDYYGEYARQ